MNFEHLIAINDPGNPLLMPLSRAQIWLGLWHRVDNPLPFLPGLESCTVVERQTTRIIRELDFGAARIRDHVTFAEHRWVRFDIEPTPQHAGGSLTIRIEEPSPEHFFLRFTYATTLAAEPGSEDAAYLDVIKSAYQQSDIDCVRIIRTLAAGGTVQ